MLSKSTTAYKLINNQNGLALVSALVLGAIGMLMVLALAFMVDNGTWLSGSKKRYQMALDGSYGGMNFYAKEIIQRGIGGTNLSAMGNYGGIFAPVISNTNFATKLSTTGDITTAPYPSDTVDTTITMTMPLSPDMIVSTAIHSTSRGNSAASSNILQGGGVVNNNSGLITPQHIPYLYQTETQGQSAVNTRENASLSSVYVY